MIKPLPGVRYCGSKSYWLKFPNINVHGLFFAAVVLLVIALSLPALAQPCTLPSQIFLPQPDQDRYEQFGSAIGVDGDHMVVGVPQNSFSQAIGGIAFVYKLDAANHWIKIAELTPSDLGKYTQFGRRVAISGNTIIVSGNDYTDQGGTRGKLYVFEKPPGGEWISGNENYFIAKPFVNETRAIDFDQFALRGDDLVTRTADVGFEEIEVYQKTAGIFELKQTIQTPGGSGFPDWNLAFGDGFFALGSDQYNHADGSSGAVFIYEKSGGIYEATPAVLRASEQSQSEWRAFGFNLAIQNTTLYVQGLKYDGVRYSQVFYIIERPQGGWADASYPQMLEESGFAYSSVQFAVNGDYLIAADENFRSIIGFKKPAEGWNSGATKFVINDPDNHGFTFGYQIQFTGTHLLIGCPNKLISDSREEEVILDMYLENGDWENANISEANKLTNSSINATDDFFGKHLSVHNGQLAITADGDDERGWSAGVVYIFDVEKQNAAPSQKIFPPEEEDGSGFGQRIAMGDSIMFICAPYKDSIASDGTVAIHSIGKVYVYRQNSSGLWTYSSQIVGPIIRQGMYFGRNVVSTPGYCAISEFNGGNSGNTGKVHIYKENEGSGKFEYLTTLGVWAYGLGQSMAMTDSVLVVGSTGSPSPTSSSAVFVFQRKGEWTATDYAWLSIDDPGWRDLFGASVSIFGNHIVVGAPQWPGFDTSPIPRDYLITGAAFVYKRPKSGWIGNLKPIAKLTSRDPTDLGAFGAKVAIDHNDIFIGSPNVYAQYNYSSNFTNNDGALIPGKVYHFTRPAGGWETTNQEMRQIQSFEPEVIDGYGSELYISDRYLFVGAMLDDTPAGIRTGSVQTMMQLPAIDELNTVCIDEDPIKLNGYPKGGQFSGPGVNAATSLFSPAAAGAGIHDVRYVRDGCEAMIQVVVLPAVMDVTHQSDPTQTKCIGKAIPIAFESNASPDDYMWYYRRSTDDRFVKFDSMKQIIHADAAGSYQVVVDRGACSPRRADFEIIDDEEVLINIEPEPAICAEDEVALSFTPQTGEWSGQGISPAGVFSPALVSDGVYKQIYTVTTPLGCVWKDSITLHVDLLKHPTLQYNGEPVCGEAAVSLQVDFVDDRSAVRWFKNGVQIMGMQSRTLDVFDAGRYFARVQKGICEHSTDEADVPKEVLEIEFDVPLLCDDRTVTLAASPPGGLWYGDVVTANGAFDASLVPDGVYPVEYDLHTQIGCHWRQSTEVVVDKLKEPILDYDTKTVCRDEPATLLLSNVDDRSTILWHSDNGTDVAANSVNSLSVDKPGTYAAAVTKGHCVLSTNEVVLIPTPDTLFVPNVFTPNGDNINDYFEVRSEGMNDFYLSVFNRYGQRMYETDKIDFHWSGGNTSPGVYFWKVTYSSCAETREELKGWVHLLR